ncbi:hypothetical protein BJV82DRAFT_518302 [Fennellomyces sp. T-0311]|nr:hypothetical protein BJV82DRAFT_518302 [Fennellomyces sp. T-0311]
MGKSRPRYNEKARASSRKPNQKPHPRARDGGLKFRPEELEQDSNVKKSLPKSTSEYDIPNNIIDR